MWVIQSIHIWIYRKLITMLCALATKMPRQHWQLHHIMKHFHLCLKMNHKSGRSEKLGANMNPAPVFCRPFFGTKHKLYREVGLFFSGKNSLLFPESSSLVCWQGVMTKALFVSWGAAGCPMYEMRKWVYFKLVSCLLALIRNFRFPFCEYTHTH